MHAEWMDVQQSKVLVTLDDGEFLGNVHALHGTTTVQLNAHAGSMEYGLLVESGIEIDPVPVAPPINVDAPYVDGGAVEGEALTSTMGNWMNEPESYTYAWQRNGVEIADATADSYTLVAEDVSTRLTATVTATNSVGSATSPPSNTVGPVLAAVKKTAPAEPAAPAAAPAKPAAPAAPAAHPAPTAPKK